MLHLRTFCWIFFGCLFCALWSCVCSYWLYILKLCRYNVYFPMNQIRQPCDTISMISLNLSTELSGSVHIYSTLTMASLFPSSTWCSLFHISTWLPWPLLCWYRLAGMLIESSSLVVCLKPNCIICVISIEIRQEKCRWWSYVYKW